MSAAGDEDKQPTRADDGEMSRALTRHLTIADHRLDSRDLFVGTREITIQHGEDAYRLRLTAQNKLILTK